VRVPVASPNPADWLTAVGGVGAFIATTILAILAYLQMRVLKDQATAAADAEQERRGRRLLGVARLIDRGLEVVQHRLHRATVVGERAELRVDGRLGTRRSWASVRLPPPSPKPPTQWPRTDALTLTSGAEPVCRTTRKKIGMLPSAERLHLPLLRLSGDRRSAGNQVDSMTRSHGIPASSAELLTPDADEARNRHRTSWSSANTIEPT
jgi:hypothetical protein